MAFALTVIMDIWHWTPLVTLTLLAALVSLPKEPFEQAQIDGANRWQIFWHVTLPMIRPAILATVFIRLMDALRTVDEVWMLTGGGPGAATRYVGLHIWKLVFPKTDYGYGSAISIIVLYLTLVMCWLLYVALVARRDQQEDSLMRANRPIVSVLLWSLLSLFTLFPIYWLFVISVKPAVELFTTPSVLLDTDLLEELRQGARRRNAAPLHDEFDHHLERQCAPGDRPGVHGLLCPLALRSGRQGEHLLLDDHQPHGAGGGVPAAVLPAFHAGLHDRRLEALRHADRHDPALLHLQPALRHLDAQADDRRHPEGTGRGGDRGRRVDLAGPREVIFPLARPGLAVTLILTWVFAWNEFLLAATLTSFNARTITTGLSEYVTTTGTEWGTMASIAIITLIPALIVFSVVQRHIVAGLTFGAVKE